MRPLVVAVDTLPAEGARYDVRIEAPEVERVLRERGQTEVDACAPLEASIRLLPSERDVFLLGNLRGRFRYRCVRCLGEFDADLDSEFHVTFAPEETATGEVELRREDLEVEPLQGGRVDVTEAVLEQAFLTLEPNPVCREGCRGLCPRCGADLNEGDCPCPAAAPDPRLAALAQWKSSRAR